MILKDENLAYVVGVALGDGNLSRPNGRATRLRITCDKNYPEIAGEIVCALKKAFPDNKVSIVPGPKETYFNISVYSNKLNGCIPWKVGNGNKHTQNACVPNWIFSNPKHMRACLKGLIQTDGSIYIDRGYKMVNFCNHTIDLAKNVQELMTSLGYKPRFYTSYYKDRNPKLTVRLARDVENFLAELKLSKA